VHLSELIQEDVIKIGLESQDKWEVIEEMVDILIDAHELRLTDRTEVIEAVTTRERSLSTGLEHGLAVPHGAVECVGDIIASLGTSARGIPFASQDGKPAHLVVLLVIPKGSFQHHVRTLAGIARLAMNQDLREKIALARKASEIVDVISKLDLGNELHS
jgi:mannitol/fructose-specific phosphotransferase system IIA component (Ntr-type)